MKSTQSNGFYEETRISLMPLQAATFGFAAIFGIVFGSQGYLDETLPTAMLLLASVLASWFLSEEHPRASAWVLLLGLTVSIPLVYLWAGLGGILAFLAVPVTVATLYAGPLAGLKLAGASTLLLAALVLLRPGSAANILTALLLTWSVYSLVAWMSRRTRYLANWSWTHYQQAIGMLEETRAHRAELLQMTEDLKHANQQMALMNRRLDAARQAAEEAQKAKASFVANVSHEFRTPLNMIIGLTDLLVETPEIYGDRLPDDLLQDLDIVRRNSEHLAAMINDVLDLSQVEAGRLALNKERVNLAEIIQKSLVVVKPLLARKGLTASVAVPEGLPEVYCDRNRIRQVIVNLLSNAARFTEKGGISVKISQNGPNAVVSVTDTGPGIANEVATRLFQPFAQGEQARDNQVETQKSSGLGLAISKEFVTLHGGQMWLESALGSGSTFHFSLPISGPLEPAMRAGGRIVESWEWVQRDAPANLDFGPARPLILLYDETGDLAPLMARYLDFAILRALPSLELLAAEARQSPVQSVVINAAQAGDLPALVASACQLLPDLPVFGCCFPARAARALQAGALGYLMKPTTRNALIDALTWVNNPVQSLLIVDDLPDELALTRRMLASWNPELDIETAASGQEALEKMNSRSHDLVLLDIVLPDCTGWEILEQKNQNPAIRDVPVIILSGMDPNLRPVENHLLAANMGSGLSLQQTLRCFQVLAGTLGSTTKG